MAEYMMNFRTTRLSTNRELQRAIDVLNTVIISGSSVYLYELDNVNYSIKLKNPIGITVVDMPEIDVKIEDGDNNDEPYEFKTCPSKVISIQYGIITPTTMWYYVDGEAKAVYEYNPCEYGRPATDKELFEAIQKLVGDDTDVTIDVQAHAASLIEYIRRNSNYKIHTYLCGFRGGK